MNVLKTIKDYEKLLVEFDKYVICKYALTDVIKKSALGVLASAIEISPTKKKTLSKST